MAPPFASLLGWSTRAYHGLTRIHRRIQTTCSASGRDRGVRLTDLAHEIWATGGFVRAGDTVCDATCGNGHDTAFLAQQIGPTGRLVAIDIQAAAMEATAARVTEVLPDEEHRSTIEFVLGSHGDIQQHVGSNVASLICFNTGYLPNSDKTVKTEIDSTIAALEGSLEALCEGGLVSMLCYTGHDGGMEEYEAIRDFAAGLSAAHWKTSEFRLLNSPTAPIMVLIWKR